MDWKNIPDEATFDKTIAALKANGIEAQVVENGAEAKKIVLEMIPQGAEVMTMTSVTLNDTGIANELDESDTFDSVKKKLGSMDRATQGREMQKLGAAPDWTIGSIHAVTQQGQVMIASNTGSQLSAYVYGAAHVIWVVGAQKIVSDEEEGRNRIYNYVLPLESERAHKAYGVAGSFISKLLTINKEVTPGRITIIFVKEVLGF